MMKILTLLLQISLLIFMVGNLLDMGLRLNLKEAMGGLKNVRFVALSLLWGFVLCPGLAVLLTKIIPLEQPYAIGMIMLGMTPCAPFLPMMVTKAKGDLSYAAAFMVLAMGVTVIYMPLLVPVMVKGLSADPWTIAKPLVFYLLIPLGIGIAIKRTSASFADSIQPIVNKITLFDTIVMLVLCVVVYGKGFINAAGSYAFGTQILFFSMATIASYFLSFGLPHNQKSVLSLGMATRNIGAALAPLFALSTIDQRAIVMVAIGVPMQTLAGVLASRWLARRASAGEPKILTTEAHK
jgi:BASS family bile acid:Na+ symporter